jgi:hypothetical protein
MIDVGCRDFGGDGGKKLRENKSMGVKVGS